MYCHIENKLNPTTADRKMPKNYQIECGECDLQKQYARTMREKMGLPLHEEPEEYYHNANGDKETLP